MNENKRKCTKLNEHKLKCQQTIPKYTPQKPPNTPKPIDPAEVNEHFFSKHLYTHHIPDPDLLIRTSGEMRLSNFLLWQVSYAEMVVTPTLWPEFRKPQFCAALEEYAKRHRRFGNL